jgi:hypothetical protein
MSNRLFDTRPTYAPDALACNTLIITQANVVTQLRKLADDQASPAFREAVAEWVAAYGVMRAAGRRLMADNYGYSSREK